MHAIFDFLRNETPMISMAITATVALLTGPVFNMDAAVVGTISAMVVAVFNIWVRFQVYSKRGATKVATAAATQAVASLTPNLIGEIGEVPGAAVLAVESAVESVLGGGDELIRPPG